MSDCPAIHRLRTLLLAASIIPLVQGGPASLLFEDTFDRGIPGWTAVQPPGNYLDGPMRWQYDIVSGGFVEQSNIYTDAAAASPSATAVMLINDAVAGDTFTYTARLIAGDDDAFGLIFGYQNPTNFYRVTFTRQVRTTRGFPWNGWSVDRKADQVTTNLFGDGTENHVPSFVNTQYVPFDVTIAVSGANLLTLTVIDGPEGVPIEYRLVEAQPLPSPAGGRVGLMQWGQSGTAVRGFRILDPILTPGPLAGDPNALGDWTPVITVRGDGSGLDASTGNGGIPIWSLALGPNGAYGTLHENSDSFGGNTADGVVDFPAGAVVAGDPTWSNYLVTARLIPADDDGQGILVRYRDAQNFCRIALRAQNSTAGVRPGLSIQKVVDSVWEEVFHEDTPAFVPTANVPYDITAVIVGNRLQVQVIANPLGSAHTYAYGPFDLSAPMLATGRIGIFSWAMSRLEIDFVRVYGIDGVPLQVNSPLGHPDPAVGLHGFAPGSTVTATVPSPIEDAPGFRRSVTGWSGTGSVPASGTGNQATFTLSEVSSITWNWQTEVRLQVSATAGGRVTSPGPDWISAGTSVNLTAVSDEGFVFSGWAGDLADAIPVLDLTLVRPLTLTAQFEADTDRDGLADAWEQRYLGNLDSGPDDDPDRDGRKNLDEQRLGTHPDHAETPLVSDPLASRWINVQRDPALPGQLVVHDFGSGFRGVWENSNDYRGADDPAFIGPEFVVPAVSFEGPRILIRESVWEPGWNDFSLEAVSSVGDNDANCVYFRYRDELNWYRVTICGENNNVAWRAPFGVTVQKRSGGVFAELAADPSMATDPSDLAFYKRIRIAVTAQGADFEVRVTGWNTLVDPPQWDTSTQSVLCFADTDHATGRIGIGTWGQSGGGPATATNPVNAGALLEDVVIRVGDQEVFREDWTGVPLAEELPAGWEPAGDSPAGAWLVTAHATILQVSNAGTPATGTTVQPRADGEGPILLAPAPGSDNYFLELGFHPFDDDGIGFIYDYRDADNFSRVLFVSEIDGASRIPRGVNVSRKSGGAWSDLLVAAPGFVYQPGAPFEITLASQNGAYCLTARMADQPESVRTWRWKGPPAAAGNRFGLTTWGETDAHFYGIRASSLPVAPTGGDVTITGVTIEGGLLVLSIDTWGEPYAVEHTLTLDPGSWTEVAAGLTAPRWTTPLPAGPGAGYYRLRGQP